MFDLGRWTFSKYRYGNGSKTLGSSLWWNESRIGFAISLGLWEVQVMRERRWK